MYDTLIKHCGHLRILEKCGKHSPTVHVFYIFFRVLSRVPVVFYHSVINALGFFIR